VKILSIVGARPQFIKASLLSRELRKKHKEVLVHTGQHYDFEMSRLFFEELEIPKPDYNLEVGSGTQGSQTGRILERIEKILLKEKPSLVLIYGDTNSTLAGALATAKLNIPLGHIEAGLRSYNRKMPEEINRIVADHLSDLLFCPTETAANNLRKEGIEEGVYKTGDVMLDLFLSKLEILKNKSNVFLKLEIKPKKYYLATLHRPGNVDNLKSLKNILEAFSELDFPVVFPVHPRTKKNIERIDKKLINCYTNIHFTSPLSYLEMLSLEKEARIILTDSGGVQKEAYFAKVPCLTLREETEWIETVEDGWNLLVGQDKEKIISEVKNFKPPQSQKFSFGDGKAVQQICRVIDKIGVEIE
jgi:UDP-N-acetylglucosamine 2-epimerase (non-hydrolysing)